MSVTMRVLYSMEWTECKIRSLDVNSFFHGMQNILFIYKVDRLNTHYPFVTTHSLKNVFIQKQSLLKVFH